MSEDAERPTPAAGAPPRDRPAARGTTTIAARAVERIAGRAVARDGVEALARVRATVTGGSATVALTIAVRWPEPVRRVTEDVRARVREGVGQLTGLEVTDVDIDVRSLVARPERPAPRVR